MKDIQLSRSNEDYLKNIWLLSEKTGKVAGVRALAKRMQLSASTVSEAMKKLTAQGYVDHHRYSGIKLTEKGTKIAVLMVRKHRLIETYLVQKLNYDWTDVHEEAEALEHAVSDYFIQRIDEILDHPKKDPHGDPIPNADGTISTLSSLKALSEFTELELVRIERVSDDNPEILAFLAKSKLIPGTVWKIKNISKTLGSITLSTQQGENIQITFPVANRIWVSAKNSQSDF